MAEYSLRVLVVDDNADVAACLAKLLPRWGHQPRVAHTGPEALAAAAAFSPDVALLDIGLPGMSGRAVARRLRAEPGCGRPVLVALSGYGGEEDRRRSLAAGFDYYLVKPVDAEELHDLLRLLAREGGSRPRPEAVPVA
jgi:CheY-like chemotaxis protein